MSDEIVFYTHPMSRGRVTRWMLEELGQPYRTELLDYGTSMKSPEYLAINPMGKVPAITHNGAVVTEGAAICTYLADAFPEAGLAPGLRDPARAPYLRWMFFAAGPLEQATVEKSLGMAPPVERSAMVGYGKFEDAIGAIEQAISNTPYIAGEKFSATDVYVGSQIGWGVMSVVKDPSPVFREYLARINGRPAAVRARGIDDALLPPKPAETA